ncbi:MAG: N-acetyltransferase family protein [Pseudomonadota bacterium]
MGIRDCEVDEAPAVCGIYNHYVERSVATFEVSPIDPADMEERIRATTARYPWLVYVDADKVIGYAYATPWKPRAAYGQTVESTVYVADEACGRGVGAELMLALLKRLAEQDVHAVLAGIALPNEASVRTHEKLGFFQVAHFRQTGRKFDRWIDIGYWQRILEDLPGELSGQI